MERVVITGIGIVSPIGIGVEKYWKAAVAGTCGITEVTSLDTSAFANHRGGEITDLDPAAFLSHAELARMERGSAMAVIAAKLAADDARLAAARSNPERIGVSMGTTMGEIHALERANRIRLQSDANGAPKDCLGKYAAINIPANVAKAVGAAGRAVIIPNACAAGNFAITYAFEMIRSQTLDIVLAGGADPISWITYTGFNRLGAMAHDVVTPFDKDSKGMMVGEGAAILVLESLGSATKRNAPIYAEVVGYGLTCDADHMTAPSPAGMVRAIKMALARAELRPEQIDSVIAHGTGTPSNDHAELSCLAEVFAERTTDVPVTSVKSLFGHTMGAASAIEAATNALIVKNDVIPPTIHHDSPHPDLRFPVRVVANSCLKTKVQYGMNNALAFGGNNSSLIMKKYMRG